MNNARDYRHKWGKIDPSYLLSENGDLSFLLFFSKQCLVENIQGKFKKKFIGNFNFWGITLIRDVRCNTWSSHLSQLIVTWLKLSASTSFRAVALLSWQALLFETSLCNFFFPNFLEWQICATQLSHSFWNLYALSTGILVQPESGAF